MRGRAADGWIAALLVAIGGTALMFRRPVSLANVEACPGLYDLATVIAGRTAADAPLGAMLSSINTGVLFVALFLAGRLIFGATASIGITAAAGLVAATAPLFAPALAPAAAASIAVCASAWLAASRAWKIRRASTLVVAIAGFTIAAGVVPPVALPLSVIIAALAWIVLASRAPVARAAWAIAAAASVVMFPLIVLTLLAPGLSQPSAISATECFAPADIPPSVELAGRIASVAGASPIIVALAVVGLFSPRSVSAPLRLSAVLTVMIAVWAAMTADSARTVAPAALAIWTLSAAGLRDVHTALDGTPARRIGATLLTLLVVGLHVPAVLTETVRAELTPEGHARLSRNMFSTLIAPMPDGAVLVAEDALTDLLVRTLPARVRERRRLRIIEGDTAVVDALAAGTPVYALPRAQRRLQFRGVRITDVAGRAVDGLAEVRAGSACAAMTAEWQPIAALAASDRLAVVATDSRAYGHVHVYLSAAAPFAPRTIEWPARARRGFLHQTFSRTDASPSPALADDLAAYDATDERGGLKGAHVAHLEVWRVPDGPLILPVDLGVRPIDAMARLMDAAPGERLTLCPAHFHEVTPIGGR